MDLQPVSVLVLCEQRSDRRVLFDTFDTMDVGSIYSAKNVVQAREFLEQVDISLLVIELCYQAEDVESLLNHFFQRNDGQVLAVVPTAERRRGFSWELLPQRVAECIASPVGAGEVGFRARRLLAQPKASDSDDDQEDLTFDGVGLPLIISDAKYGEILAVNQEFADWAGTKVERWAGRPLDDAGLVEEPRAAKARWRVLRSDGQVRYRCKLSLPDQPVREVEVVRRLGVHRNRMAYLTRLLDVGREVHVNEGLELAGALISPAGGDAMDPVMLERLCRWLGVDLFHIAAIDADGGTSTVVAHCLNDSDMSLDQVADHLPYRKICKGEEVIAGRNAARVIGQDHFVQTHAIEGYIGVPVMTSEAQVVGALIVASARTLDPVDVRSAVLRLVAASFGRRRELRDLRQQSEVRGLHDPLTGLPNRMLFNDRLNLALKEAQRAGETFAVVFVDLDRFKTINDSLGHNIGDQVLLGVADRLQAVVRGSDTVARYAGDEFTMLLRHIVQKDDVMRVAHKVNKALSEPLAVTGSDELLITASVGVSFFPDDGRTRDVLLKRADQAMYSAKSMGRNTCQSYVARDEESQQQKLKLESRLRVAEANNELRVFYQPQVDAKTEDIVGMEALIRWEHPELGLISPGFFIPLAEETGLIVSIGEWLMRLAVQETKEWQQRFGIPLTLGVNLSPLQLKQPDLTQIVEKALNDAHLEPRFLDLEVTESISIKSIAGLREKLEALRELGCKVSIDDFGTGQSSLDYLKRFPADRIKIDQSFVRNMTVDPDDAAIVRATINMAHSLKMGVIAEGVEEEEHLEFLRAEGCDELQGYLFCRPIPSDAFSRMLIEREQLLTGRFD